MYEFGIEGFGIVRYSTMRRHDHMIGMLLGWYVLVKSGFWNSFDSVGLSFQAECLLFWSCPCSVYIGRR